MNNKQAIMHFILLAAVFAAVAFLGEQGKLIGGVFMSDQRDDGLIIHYKQDFTEISSDDLDRLLADQVRLREALAGLMSLTSAAYGSQVTEVPEYVAALKAMEGNQ